MERTCDFTVFTETLSFLAVSGYDPCSAIACSPQFTAPALSDAATSWPKPRQTAALAAHLKSIDSDVAGF